ncbi:6-pyruvoyl trahydropterin synthase family protein [Natrarchaeobius chitinivorans]|uniref:6-carboxytetrahydropterin synthase n=1 Tax=Natrarchaeobius chitinivorans TaxID=1679083 RepID=A0A3N6NXJ0_NATCH|nr:6-pyruvoyl tetrahydropterin synthase family protein [Natrarchaeobius chitinivorans]RQG89429.1 6-carboxytetrahydropterin synthase [Natrarchaeobius chitinivorans]
MLGLSREDRTETDRLEPTDGTSERGEITETRRQLRIGHERPIRLSTGHRIRHHDGKCSRPHGHNYEVAVTLEGTLTPEGWVVDKGDVTAVVEEWDHRFVLERGDPLIEAFRTTGDEDAVVVLERPPTAEVMSVVLEEKLEAELPENVLEVAVQVSETSELCGGSTL